MTSISGRRSQSSMRSGTSSDFYEPPTAQEIMEHGRYLGLDPVYDVSGYAPAHLMWIAEESLCAPLPAFWEDHVDDQGNVYYRNRRTGQTSRYHPLDKKYKKKVLQAKMGDLQNKLGEIDPERREGSVVPEQPGGLQQQYYQKIVPQGAGQPAREQLPSKHEDSKRGGFFTSLKRLVPTRKDNAVPSTDDGLNQTLQLLETIDRRTKSRDPVARSATPSGTDPQQHTAPVPGGASKPGHIVPVPSAGPLSTAGPVRKSRSRASFQLQSATPVSRPAGLPADPHDGGPHEDVKDMATYLRLDPQRDYRFMWVSQLAMSEPVPHNWKEMYDEQGYPYYVNQINGKTSRRHPSDAFYNQLVKYEKIRELTEGPRQEIGAWMDFTDFDGSTYYYNFEINMSSSHRPHFGLQNKRLIDRLKLEATIELEHYVATKIQSMWRRHLVKKIVRDRKREVDAAITIQRAFRRYINRDLDKRRKMAQIHSARRIQAHYRGRMARKQVKEMANSREQHVAATKIQATFRGRRARRALVEPYVRRIQANWRGYMARKIILPLMKDRKLFASVVKVQTAWRAKAERTAVGRKYQDQKRKWAAKKVQAHWRGFVTRVEYERMLEEEYEGRAAENAEKKKARLEELRTRAAITIQSSWKTYKSRQFLKMIQAVLTMQRRRRDTQEIRNAREQLHQIRTGNKMKSALVLQRYWRGHCGRRWIAEQRARAVAAIVKQAAQRRDVKRNLLKKQEQAATVISCRVRQRIAKQRLAVMKATLRLQTIFRSCRARKLYRHLRAAIVLQSVCRLYAARIEATQLRRIGAIVRIQQCWRGFLGRETGMLLRRRTWAVVTLQRDVRGFLTRRYVQDLKLENCVVYIQKAWRGKAARLRYFDALNKHWEEQHRQREHDAATVLQARWRGRTERRRFSSQLAEHRALLARTRLENACAIVLETLIRARGCRAAHLQRLEDIRRGKAAVSIQKWWRGVMAKRVVQLAREARDLQVHTDAAVVIQKNWRRHSCVGKYKTTLMKRNESILYMQSLWRMKQARRERQRRVLFNTAVKLQARFRGKQARRRADALRREQELENRCALILQACCRCFVEMQAFDTTRLHVAASVMIQSTWRQHKAQCCYRRDLAEHNARATAGALLQALCRMSISRRDFKSSLTLRKQELAAVRIQASWRAKLTRRWFAQEADRLREEYRQNVIAKMVSSYEHRIEVIEAAAVRVQKHFRGVTARRRVVKERQRRAAVAIQKNVRGLLCRKEVLRLLGTRYDWMLVSLLLLDVPLQRDADLRSLRDFSQRMLVPQLNPQVRRFAWLMKIKRLCATLIQKIVRGRLGRRLAINSIKSRVDRLSFGPELRRLRSELPVTEPPPALSTCLHKMEMIVIQKHDIEAAKYVQRCYRGRLGRRFMRVLRGHSNMNRIRRVMMPIVLRGAAPTFTATVGLRDPVVPMNSGSVDRSTHAGRTRDVLVQPRANFVSLGSMMAKTHMALPDENQHPRFASFPPLVDGSEQTESKLDLEYRQSTSLGATIRPLPPVRMRANFSASPEPQREHSLPLGPTRNNAISAWAK